MAVTPAPLNCIDALHGLGVDSDGCTAGISGLYVSGPDRPGTTFGAAMNNRCVSMLKYSCGDDGLVQTYVSNSGAPVPMVTVAGSSLGVTTGLPAGLSDPRPHAIGLWRNTYSCPIWYNIFFNHSTVGRNIGVQPFGIPSPGVQMEIRFGYGPNAAAANAARTAATWQLGIESIYDVAVRANSVVWACNSADMIGLQATQVVQPGDYVSIEARQRYRLTAASPTMTIDQSAIKIVTQGWTQ